MNFKSILLSLALVLATPAMANQTTQKRSSAPLRFLKATGYCMLATPLALVSVGMIASAVVKDPKLNMPTDKAGIAVVVGVQALIASIGAVPGLYALYFFNKAKNEVFAETEQAKAA